MNVKSYYIVEENEVATMFAARLISGKTQQTSKLVIFILFIQL